MTINKNWTYSSDGGYAAGNKQKEYVPKSVAKKASLMLREQERQRLIEAAKRLDAQTRGAAAEGNNGFGMVNSRQTFPEVIAVNRNAGAGNVQNSSAAPRNVRDVLDQPESTWRSGSFNGVIDPRAKNEFLNNIGAGSSAPKPAPKPAEKPEEEKKPQVFLSDAQKTRYGLLSNMGEIAGEKVDVEPIREWFRENKNREYKPTPREEFLYNRNKDMGDIAGGDFYDYFIKFKNPSMVNYTPPYSLKQRIKTGEGVFNAIQGNKINDNSENQAPGGYTPPPYMKRKIQIGEGIFHGIQNGEKLLSIEDHGDVLGNMTYAAVNNFIGQALHSVSGLLRMRADYEEATGSSFPKEFMTTAAGGIGRESYEQVASMEKGKLEWMRSLEDGSDYLALAEKQYANGDEDAKKIVDGIEDFFGVDTVKNNIADFLVEKRAVSRDDADFILGTLEYKDGVSEIVKDVEDKYSAKLWAGKCFPIVLGVRNAVDKYEEYRDSGMSVEKAYKLSSLSGVIRAVVNFLDEKGSIPTGTGGAAEKLVQDIYDKLVLGDGDIDTAEIAKELAFGIAVEYAARKNPLGKIIKKIFTAQQD